MFLTLDCSVLGLHFKNNPIFKGVGGEGGGKTWQHSRNQHYDSTIASIFSLAFPSIEILEDGEVEIKF